jgi:hypothetical protein
MLLPQVNATKIIADYAERLASASAVAPGLWPNRRSKGWIAHSGQKILSNLLVLWSSFNAAIWYY